VPSSIEEAKQGWPSDPANRPEGRVSHTFLSDRLKGHLPCGGPAVTSCTTPKGIREDLTGPCGLTLGVRRKKRRNRLRNSPTARSLPGGRVEVGEKQALGRLDHATNVGGPAPRSAQHYCFWDGDIVVDNRGKKKKGETP